MNVAERRIVVKTAFEEPMWYIRGRSYHIQARTEFVREYAARRHSKQILDVGCGDGSISIPMLGPETELTLVDLSEGMLAIARSRIPPNLSANVKTLNSDAISAELSVGSYDLVICLGVLAYVDCAEALISRLTRLLRPGGSLFIECTDGAHFVSTLLRVYGYLTKSLVETRVSTVLHTRKEILVQCEKAGLRLAGIYRYCSPPPVLRKMFTQEFHYRIIRRLFGRVTKNRVAWLGNECIFLFNKEGSRRE